MSGSADHRNRPTRGGFALVLSLLLLLALAVMGAGVVALGAREAIIARQGARLAQLRLDAEVAAREAAAAWSTAAWLAAEREGRAAGDLHPAAELDVRAERLAPGLYMVQARSRMDQGPRPPLRASAALLLHALEPEALLAAFPAALAAEGPAAIEGGTLSGEDACRTGGAVPFAWGEDVRVSGTAMTDGSAAETAPPPPLPSPDPLSDPLLGAVADLVGGPGEVRPRPSVTAGLCERGPENWGAISAASPCHALLPVVRASGPLILEEGEGRGILVVEGDLLVGGDFRFHGLLLVRGGLTVRDAARIGGAIRAGSVFMEGGHIQYDGCQAAAAASAPALDGAFRPRGRWWIPSF